MAFRRIPHQDRVEAILGCMEIKNTKEMAKKYNVSEATLIEDCNDLLKEVDEMLKKRSLVGRLKIKLRNLLQKSARKIRMMILISKRRRNARVVVHKT